MNFIKVKHGGSVTVPGAMMVLAGLDQERALDMHAMDNAVVLLKRNMDAGELVLAIEGLSELVTGLILTLGAMCRDSESRGSVTYYDLSDIKPETLDMLVECGIRLHSLDELAAKN